MLMRPQRIKSRQSLAFLRVPSLRRLRPARARGEPRGLERTDSERASRNSCRRARAEPLGQGVSGDDRGVSICYPQPAARPRCPPPRTPSACHPRNQGGHGHYASPADTQSEPRHGVGCPRQACLAPRPQRRVLSNAMPSSASAGTPAREGRVDSASPGWLLQALAEGWNAIRARHEELPPVILVIGPSPVPAATRIELGASPRCAGRRGEIRI